MSWGHDIPVRKTPFENTRTCNGQLPKLSRAPYHLLTHLNTVKIGKLRTKWPAHRDGSTSAPGFSSSHDHIVTGQGKLH